MSKLDSMADELKQDVKDVKPLGAGTWGAGGPKR